MQHADLIIKNGNIHTMNPAKPTAAAVAVRGNEIVYVGDNPENYCGAGTKVVDAEGRVVLPGIVDAHAHPLSMPSFEGVALDIGMDLETVLSEIKKYVDAHPEKHCYLGQVYLETCVGDRYTKETLDSVCPDKPIILLGSTCHESWANSKAFETAGVDKDFPDPIPGKQYFVRDENGEPTGVIKDVAPFEIIADACKPCPADAVEKGMVEFFHHHNELGITTSADCGILTPANEQDTLEIAEKLMKEDRLTCRISGCGFHLGIEPVEETIDHIRELNERFDNDIIRIKTFKLLQDGCYEARTSSCYEPYLDTEFMRDPTKFGEQLKSDFVKVAEAGFDIHVHCLGDRAMHETIEAAGAVRKAGFADNRITIAHNHSILPEDIAKYGEYNIVANFTPQWCVVKPDIINGIGRERHDDMIRIKSVKDSGAIITIGSDCPSDELGYEPWKGMEMSITRRTCGCPDEEMMGHASECIDVQTALEACTINGAYELGMEDRIGSLEEGKYADIIILDRDIYDIDVYDIHNVRPVMTVFNGKIVYDGRQ